MLLGCAGALLPLVVIFADYPGWHHTSPLTGTPEFELWVLLAAGAGASWAVAAVPVSRALRALWPFRVGNERELIGSAAAYTVLVWAFAVGAVYRTPIEYPLPHHHVKVLLLTAFAFTVSLGAAIGIWLVHAALVDAFPQGDAERAQLDLYLALRDQLRRLVAVEGAILAAGILMVGALRNAVIASHAPAAMFPREYVLLYGAYFSALLALVYAPVHVRQMAAGRQLRDRLAPVPALPCDDIVAWCAARRATEELLQLPLGSGGGLQTAFSILAPIASSIVALVLGTQ